MYYTVYEIINLVNGKIYIGIHKTDNLDDGYFGSGINIKRAINKYGLDNFHKKYIAIFDNTDEMYEMESELVNTDFLDSNTYNITEGGNGGWYHINERLDKTIRHQIAVKAGKSSLQIQGGGKALRMLVPPKIREEQARCMGSNFGGSNKLTNAEVKERLSLISHIDMNKWGWVTLAADIWGVSHTQVKRFIDKHYSGRYYRR